MSDVFTREKRSLVMARIRGRGNRDTEVFLARHFRRAGITGWRRHYAVIGRPDFAFPARRLAVFVDGCFWHGCPRCYIAPRNNAPFWRRKILQNRERDRVVNQALRGRGWKVVRIWECRLQKGWDSLLGRITLVLRETR